MRCAWAAVLAMLLCARAVVPDDAPKKEPDQDAPKEAAKETPTPEKTTPPKASADKSEADQLKERLLTVAAGGKLTDDLVTLFGTYALSR
ncbi:MAG TPA: hypothetical protein VMZ92_01025, partial [Planctomycetota bacterium]|nr:hypothetical protein [Planctomycetota bacterium]